MSHATLGPFKGLILFSSHPLPRGSGPHFIDKALRGEDVIDPRACSQDLNPGFSDTQIHAVTTGQNGDRGERVPEADGDGFWQQLYPLGWRRDGLAVREVWPWGPVSPGSLSSPSAAAPGLASLCEPGSPRVSRLTYLHNRVLTSAPALTLPPLQQLCPQEGTPPPPFLFCPSVDGACRVQLPQADLQGQLRPTPLLLSSQPAPLAFPAGDSTHIPGSGHLQLPLTSCTHQVCLYPTSSLHLECSGPTLETRRDPAQPSIHLPRSLHQKYTLSKKLPISHTIIIIVMLMTTTSD